MPNGKTLLRAVSSSSSCQPTGARAECNDVQWRHLHGVSGTPRVPVNGGGGGGGGAVSQFGDWLSSAEQQYFSHTDSIEPNDCRFSCRRLKPTLATVVTDQLALGYFVNFLAGQDALPLLLFWLRTRLLLPAALPPPPLAATAGDSALASGDHEPLSGDQLRAALLAALPASEAADQCRDAEYTHQYSAVDCCDRLLLVTAGLPCQLQAWAAEWRQLRQQQQHSVKEEFSHHQQQQQQQLVERCTQLVERCTQLVLLQLETHWLVEFVQSECFDSCQSEMLAAGPLDICDVLFNSVALFCFTEFMEQAGVSVLLEFWLSSTNFSEYWRDLSRAGQYDAAQAQTDAMTLYEKYFSLQAPCRLGFSDRVRRQMELSICAECGPSPGCFDTARLLLHNVLQQHYFQPFLRSAPFLRYRRDTLLNSSLRSCSSRQSLTDRTDTLSTCSSEQTWPLSASSHQQNKQRQQHHQHQQQLQLDHCSDSSRQLYLRHSHGLSIGRIDTMGRYESSLPPQPGAAAGAAGAAGGGGGGGALRSRRSHLTRVVRSLLKTDESREKEEMAWRAAQLIVRDVTSVTMPTPLAALSPPSPTVLPSGDTT